MGVLSGRDCHRIPTTLSPAPTMTPTQTGLLSKAHCYPGYSCPEDAHCCSRPPAFRRGAQPENDTEHRDRGSDAHPAGHSTPSPYMAPPYFIRSPSGDGRHQLLLQSFRRLDRRQRPQLPFHPVQRETISFVRRIHIHRSAFPITKALSFSRAWCVIHLRVPVG
jgi:hypothetical protein